MKIQNKQDRKDKQDKQNKQRAAYSGRFLSAKTMMPKTILCGALFAALIGSLQGCVELAVGTAVMGSMAAVDRRTLGAQTEDKAILVKGETRVAKLVGDAGHVNVTSFNRKVLLTGEVKDEAMKSAVEREINTLEGVQSVVNDLEVSGIASLTSRSNDAFITGKVKASFIDAKDLQATSLKVVTEHGVVYLLGRVTQREGALAAQIASGVGGVRKVIKLFEYISEEELGRLMINANNQNPAP